jgi:Tfp pilus assembly protein PilO
MTAKRQWTLFTALGCLLILIAGYMLLVRPQHSKATSLKTQTTSVQQQVQSLDAQLGQLEEESRNIAAQQATLAQIAAELPATPQLPKLLLDLDLGAKRNFVDLVNVAPGQLANFTLGAVPLATASATAGGVAAEASAATSTTTTTSAGTAVPGLADIPVALTVSGNYYQLENFLHYVEGLQRQMIVTGFSLSYHGGATTTSSTPVIDSGEINATINTEVFMSTAAIGSAGATATTTP